MKGQWKVLRYLFPVCGLGLFLLWPQAAGAGVRAGLELCAQALIPTLFPVSVLAGCLLRMGTPPGTERLLEPLMRRLFGLSGAGTVPLLLGLVSGYPLGTRLVAAAYREGRLSREEALRLSGLCSNAGPGFLLGALGTLLGSPRLGLLLLMIQLLSCLLAGALLRPRGPVPRVEGGGGAPAPMGFLAALPRALGEIAEGMLRLTGAVVFFRAALNCAEQLLPLTALPGLWRAAAAGFLELAGGTALLGDLPQGEAFVAASALSAWGGVCVHLQAAEALSEVGLSLGPCLRHKTLQALLALLLALGVQGIGTVTGVFALVLPASLIFFAVFKKTRWKTAHPVV